MHVLSYIDSTRRRARLVTFLITVILMCISPFAWSQHTHESDFGVYKLRSSLAPSESLPAESAASLNIPRQPDVAVFNVTILRNDSVTVPAEVSVVATNLVGAQRRIGLAKSQTGAWVSYTGFFHFLPNEVLDFDIRARPMGSTAPLKMSYREQLWAPEKKP